MLGLALGDAVGSRRSDIPVAGMLEAGAATQLAAWTAEGLLRTATRYGGYVVSNPTDVLTHAYQRWVLLRGERPSAAGWFPLVDLVDVATRGWLIDVPAMAQIRGSSPATVKAIAQGHPVSSAGCQALLRSLPIAGFLRGTPIAALDDYARAAAGITHDDGMRNASTGFAVRLAAACLQSDSFQRAFDTTIGDSVPDGVDRLVERLIDEGMAQPCVPQLLERLAPDKTASSALAGGIMSRCRSLTSTPSTKRLSSRAGLRTGTRSQRWLARSSGRFTAVRPFRPRCAHASNSAGSWTPSPET